MAPHQPPQQDYMVADILDPRLKSDIPSLEHPLFALRAGDKRARKYERGGVMVEVRPGASGAATVHDQAVWYYCTSQLVEALNRGRDDVSRIVRFTAYDFLTATNRPIAGVGYMRLGDALRRLGETRIETNIATDGRRTRAGFGLIDAWQIVERDHDDRMVAIEVTLPDWLWRSILARDVLTLSRDYFLLRRPLDRRIYAVARKHCGAQPKWRVTLTTLREKSGSTSSLREFRRLLTATDELPDYRMVVDDGGDMVTFYSRAPKGTKAQISDLLVPVDILAWPVDGHVHSHTPSCG